MNKPSELPQRPGARPTPEVEAEILRRTEPRFYVAQKVQARPWAEAKPDLLRAEPSD